MLPILPLPATPGQGDARWEVGGEGLCLQEQGVKGSWDWEPCSQSSLTGPSFPNGGAAGIAHGTHCISAVLDREHGAWLLLGMM
jgi:hypothetical protein